VEVASRNPEYGGAFWESQVQEYVRSNATGVSLIVFCLWNTIPPPEIRFTQKKDPD